MVSIVDELPGLVVVHDEKGIGRISDADDSRVTVNMWVPQRGCRFSPEGEFQNRVLDAVTDLSSAISWGLVTSSFLESSNWNVAPDEDELRDTIESIVTGPSNVVIHTSNPPRPFEYAETMEEIMESSLERGDLQYDHDLLNSISGISWLVDWSLSWFLIRKRESDEEYHHRLTELKNNLDSGGFTNSIFPYLPEIVKGRLVHHASAIVATRYLQGGSPGDVAAFTEIEDVINRRTLTYRRIIDGFARSYGSRWLNSRIQGGRSTFVSERNRIRGR